jgi:hypothetical protein
MSKVKKVQEIDCLNIITLLVSKAMSDKTKRGNLLEDIIIEEITKKSKFVLSLNHKVNIYDVISDFKDKLQKKELTYSSAIKFKTDYCDIKIDAIITSDEGELYITEIKTNGEINTSQKQNAYNRFVKVKNILVDEYHINDSKIKYLYVIFKSDLQNEKLENYCGFKNYGDEYVNCYNGKEFCEQLDINYNIVLSKISDEKSPFYNGCVEKLKKIQSKELQEFYDYLKKC